MLAASCSDSEKKKETEQQQKEEHAGKQYVCPMKCISPTASPGKCPKCGMTLEEVNPS
jgi:hypothetical protein